MNRQLVFAGLLLVLSTGCAGGRIYQNGINHMYLCAVRVVRTQGYQVRDEDFGLKSGTLIAGRSTPDPRETPIGRGFFKQVWEVLSNMYERREFEFWDKDMAFARIRTEERVVITMKAGNGLLRWFGWNARTRTTVKVEMDETEYGRSDWVIRRKTQSAAVRDGVHAALADCLVKPSKYAIKKYKPAVVATAETAPDRAVPEEPAPVAAAPDTGKTAVGGPAPEATASVMGTVAPAQASPAPVASEARGASMASSAGPAGQALPLATPVASNASEAGHALPLATPVTPATDPAKTLADGRKRYEDGAWPEAAADLESVVAAEPDNAEALGYLGAVYYQQKRIPESIAAYERYIGLVPSDLRTQEFLAEMKRTGGTGK